MLIASLSCSDPALSFREFYAVTHQGEPAFPSGYRYETVENYLTRLSAAYGDFLDYRVARMEKCR